MALPWIRLDTSMFDHPKMLDLIEGKRFQSIVLHLSAMTYAGKHGTDGHISRTVLRILPGRTADAKTLVDAGMWKPDGDGWRIHGWDEYQVSDDESRLRRQRAKKGGCIKNHGPECGCWRL